MPTGEVRPSSLTRPDVKQRAGPPERGARFRFVVTVFPTKTKGLDMDQKIIALSQAEMPRQWYNIQADLPTPLDPAKHPATGQPVGPDDLSPIFPMGLILQEVSQERYIEIPEEVLKVYSIWRPSPLVRATGLEKALDTPAKIFFKNESVSPAGSHKPNTAVPQVYYNKIEGIKRISTETGAGQWGSAMSLATKLFGLECTVYMVRVSFEQNPTANP